MFKSMFNRAQEVQTLPKINQITAGEVTQRLDAGEPLFLLDVRSPMEYQFDGHISGSRLLPLNTLSQRLSELPGNQPIIVICRSGNRSQFACEQLAAQGFDNVSNLTGGMFAWKMAGLPTQ